MYVLPDALRSEFKKIFGTLIREPDEEILRELTKDRCPVVCIGDVVTYTLLSCGIRMDVAVVDHSTCRGDFVHKEKIIAMIENKIRICNEPATISDEAFSTIKEVMSMTFPKEKPLLVEVEGEEDLLLMPAVIHAPDSSVLFYGEPDAGMVAVYPDEELRNEMIHFLGMMEESRWKSK